MFSGLESGLEPIHTGADPADVNVFGPSPPTSYAVRYYSPAVAGAARVVKPSRTSYVCKVVSVS